MGYWYLAFLLIGCALGEDGYAAPPASTYGAPEPAYGAPDPGTGYGAPETGYGPPATGYGSGSGYEATAEAEGKDIVALITELLPLFLAVFAAIILAGLVGPLLAGILGIIAPIGPVVGGAKGGIWNLILGLFGLQLCNLATPPVAVPPFAGFFGRSLE